VVSTRKEKAKKDVLKYIIDFAIKNSHSSGRVRNCMVIIGEEVRSEKRDEREII
jgi:hypothetical protein